MLSFLPCRFKRLFRKCSPRFLLTNISDNFTIHAFLATDHLFLLKSIVAEIVCVLVSILFGRNIIIFSIIDVNDSAFITSGNHDKINLFHTAKINLHKFRILSYALFAHLSI